jgi:hypothetical protein
MYAFSHECPNCGAPVPFASAIAVFAVCGHCRSSVVRRDAQVELMGQQAQLPPDISPLQIGTRGDFDGRSFTIIGRVRVGYREGTWNEWCADFGEGVWGWVAEAQGFYLVSFEVAPPDDLPGVSEWRKGQGKAAGGDARGPGDEEDDEAGGAARRPGRPPPLIDYRLSQGREVLKVGRSFTIAGTAYRVRDTKQTEILFSEGSLPFVAIPGRAAISGDLGGPDRAFANLEYSNEGIRLFTGRYCTFEDLKFQDLRPLPGWTTKELDPTRRQADALNCVNCGAALELRAAGLSMTAVCLSCGSLLDTSHPAVQLVATAVARQSEPILPIGSRGTMRGTEYECIGFLRRRDNYGDVWFEYLLFNPFAGFRWLVTYQGHWSFVEMLLEEPPAGSEEPVVDGVAYRLFGRGVAEVTYVLGEFYWQVRHKERTEVADYISPPRILSSEKYPELSEITWSRGEYVPAAEVYEAFALPGEVPEPVGCYLNQPNPHLEKGRTLRWLLPVLAAVLLVISLISAVTRSNERAFNGSFVSTQAGTNGAIVTEVFELRGSHVQAVEITLEAAVYNCWLETGIDLVNVQTGQVEREIVVGVDFYAGYDDGGWEEGSRKRSVLVPAVPPGRYRLLIEPSMDPREPPLAFQLTLDRDVMVWSNVWLGVAALLAYPIFRWFREHGFERERWSMSDFSPYASAEADDDDDD